ncbi:hypothetical protein [Bifidobacterium callitrichos]|uniref:Membrane protein n=1 Tax=Bifidobacterium callitrichos DSM 23973 TaxID=1437609 RepID=A0A086ZVS5_9BIFI|nr:hypothetical protein [Bifidobacterium callitrichos]KFI50625.1 membrane protein [Bifidobacterium callitrichos DSM 23973]
MRRPISGLVRACATACALVAASSLALGGAIVIDTAAQHAVIPSIDGASVFTVIDDDGEPGDLFLVDAGDSSASDGSGRPIAVTQVEAGKRAIPLDVDVSYSLDGPNVDRATITGATGVVGVHIQIHETLLDDLTDAGSDDSRRFLIVFTVPTRVADDLTVSTDSSIVGTQGSNTLVAAVVRAGEQVDCYMNAKKFTMGQIAFVSAPGSSGVSVASALAAEAQAMGDGSATFSQSGQSDASGKSKSTVSTVAGDTGSGRYQHLIDQLTKLRDLERSLASSEIASKQADYDKAFHTYMAAYVGSYTNHLSGSIGSSTQLTALMGTAGELSGDTPLAKAVLGEANATDALASAHQHTGAADAIDQVIRMVRAQGVDGLVNTLRRRAGEEETEGAKEYSAGQSQLSQAMIPYSMAYTDAYTKHLSALTGGTSAGAASHLDEALAETDKEFASSGAHAGDTAKVNAALSALASARERTGAAAAYRQITLRFADELSGVGAASGAGTSDTMGSDVSGGNSGFGTLEPVGSNGALAARAEVMRLRKLADAERRAAKASSGDVTTTVVDETAATTDASDVMKFAGGIPGAGGASGASGEKSGEDESKGTADSATTSGKSGGGKEDKATAETARNRLSPYFGMVGMDPGPMLVVDTDELINDTTVISDAGELIASALDQGADKLLSADASAGDASATVTRFLIVEPAI